MKTKNAKYGGRSWHQATIGLSPESVLKWGFEYNHKIMIMSSGVTT